MRKNFLITAVLALLSLVSLASAQDAAAPFSVAFVSSSAALAAHPTGQEATKLSEQARTELQSIAETLQPLQARQNAGETLSAEEQNALELSQRTYQETQQRYQQDIDASLKPVTDEINKIIKEIAAKNGYSLVFNYDVAQTSGLVVYADDNVPNITEEVVAQIRAAHPDAASGGSN